MTTDEFSNEFDVLISSFLEKAGYNADQIDKVNFNEYDKSVFLTDSQNELVINLYSGKTQSGDSFETSEELRSKLDSLVVATTITNPTTNTNKLQSTDVVFTLPSDLWFIVYEHVLNGNTIIPVIPVTHNEFTKTLDNPFRGPSADKILRLDIGDHLVELVTSISGISTYVIRYLKKPSPIILINLPTGLSIEGISVQTECALNTSVHREILRGAVLKALQSKALLNPNK